MRNEVELRSILTTFCEDNLDVNWYSDHKMVYVLYILLGPIPKSTFLNLLITDPPFGFGMK